MHAAPRGIWRPLRSIFILTCVGGVVLAADNTWLSDLRFDFAATDWWSRISPVETQTADIAVAPDPASHRAPQLSMGQLVNGLLFSKPSKSWRLAPETADFTSAWMMQQNGGGFAASSGTDYYSKPSFFSADVGGHTASISPLAPAAITSTGTWTSGVSGNWSTPGNWSGGTIADGAGNDAHFDTTNIANNVTVTLDTSRTIGNLFIGDTDGTHAYTISPSAASTLTFDSAVPFQNSILQQSATSGGDTVAVNIFIKNNLEINNLSSANLFRITGNIASSAAGDGTQFLVFNNATGATGQVLVNGVISNGAGSSRLAVSVENGLVIFTGTNTYTGSTSVDGGTLLINGDNAAAPGSVFVGSGGTLGGTGQVGGNVETFDGTITGGTATTVGQLTLRGSVNLATHEGDGTYVANLLNDTSDLLSIVGTLTLGSGSILDIQGMADGHTTYTLATFGSRTADPGEMALFETVMGIPSGYSLVYSDFDIELVPTAIPEPATWIGGALALGAIGFVCRRRLRAAIAAVL